MAERVPLYILEMIELLAARVDPHDPGLGITDDARAAISQPYMQTWVTPLAKLIKDWAEGADAGHAKYMAKAYAGDLYEIKRRRQKASHK